MRTAISITVALATIAATSITFAQSSTPSSTPQSNQSSQQRPDARYPNPSGQDSKPSTTTVKPTPTPQSSKTPQDSNPGAAAPQTYQDGKKRDAAPGCSTPTDAASAHNAKPSQQRSGSKTVCTTSGADSQSAKKPPSSQSPPKDH